MDMSMVDPFVRPAIDMTALFQADFAIEESGFVRTRFLAAPGAAAGFPPRWQWLDGR
jgi:hypothetical protein